MTIILRTFAAKIKIMKMMSIKKVSTAIGSYKNMVMMGVAAVTFCGVNMLTSCATDDPVQSETETPSATDPLPYPKEYLDNKDLSVKPGDSFFDYCNGTWLANNPIPADPTVNLGGLYAAGDKMNERLTQLKSSVPDISKFYTLIDQIHGHSTQSRSYITAQKAKIQKPASKEEAYRAIGKMLVDGVNVLRISFMATWDKTQLKGVLLPEGFVSPDEEMVAKLQEQRRIPLPQSRAGSQNSVPSLLAEGMGIDPAMLIIEPAEATEWDRIWNAYTVDQLYKMMQDAWLEYEAYADAEGLADYNKTLPEGEQLTMDKLRANARTELGYTISYHLQQKFVPQSLKDKYLNITKEIQASLRKRIQKVDWMSETTKQNAIDKVNHYTLNVAFPDTWHMDCIPTLTDCNTMVEALHRLKAGNARLLAALIGTNDIFSYYLTLTSTDSNGNPMPLDLTLVNATYSLNFNAVTIFPAMLLPPMMPEGDVSEACYYAAFSIIGHEFTHGFDNNGAMWDKYGQKNNWWTITDMMNFQDRKENLIRTYSNMELDPKREPLFFCDGNRTQSENIADLGGFLTALDAYTARLDAQGFTGETRKEQLRKFYESYAHVWCIQYGQKKFDILKKSDVHAHGRLRINGVVMNTDCWYDLYGVNRSHRLYLPTERRAYIW